MYPSSKRSPVFTSLVILYQCKKFVISRGRFIPVKPPSTKHQVGDEIKKDSECQTCTCQDSGNMQCTDFKCPALTCAANEVEAHMEDACCGYCASDWVKVGEPL